MSNYVECRDCDNRLSCPLSKPSEPSFGCLAGVENGQAARLRSTATLTYLKGENYHIVTDGPIIKIHQMAAEMPFIEIGGVNYPTFALPYGVTV
jgi:hypothetical protein